MKRNEILNKWISYFKKYYGIELVRRHRTPSKNSYVEFIFTGPLVSHLSSRQNSLKDAESCGYWVMVRPQKSPKKAFYKGHQVFQMFLTPVHPKKKLENKILAAIALEFIPVVAYKHRKMTPQKTAEELILNAEK